MENNDNNANRTPLVGRGCDVPLGATVAHQVGDDWEVAILEDPAAVLASDELVAVLDEPEPRPWPSAPLDRWGGDDSEPGHALASIVRALSGNAGGEAA